MSDEPQRTELVELAAALRASIVPLSRDLRRVDADLTPTQLSVLGSIFRCGPVAFGELAELERLSPPMISRVVATLDERGLVERQPGVSDRRVCRVALSKVGENWIAAGRAERNAELARRLAMLTGDELRQLTGAAPILERLSRLRPDMEVPSNG